MKKITLWLLVLLSSWQITAQVSSYVFSQTSGTYTPITGGLLLGTTTSDDQKFVNPAVLAGGTGNTGVGLPIGFNFTFNGLVFDRVAVNNNGWISFGQSALTPSVDINSTSAYTPLASVVANTPGILRNRIAGIAADLEGQTGSTLRIETIGTAPNRTLVVQWSNYRRFSQTGSNLSFQIRLNETVNTVDVVFDTLTFNATSSTAHIGLGGTVSTDFDNRTTTTNWNSTISGITNADSCTFLTGTVTPPAPGLKLTWTPGPVCTGMPSAGTSLPASLLLLPSQAVGNLVVSDYTPDVSGFAFQWQESLDNGGTWNNATGGTNATTPTYTPPVFSGTTIQYRLAVTCTATADVAFSTVSTIQACGAYTVPVLEPLTTFLPTCWQEADNGDLTAGPAIFLSGSWLVDGFANVGTTGAARVTLDAATDNDWVISPLFTIPAVGYELKFDAAATQSGGTGVLTTAWESDDFVEVLVSTTMNNWTVLYTYNDTNVPSNTGAANILDLSAYSGQDVRFAFRAVEGATNGAASVDFFIDNFEIRLTPACSEPTTIVTGNITSSSVEMSWTPPATVPAVGYEYFVSTVNTTPTVNGTSVATSFATSGGLLSNTTYYIFVRSDCGAGVYSAWTGPVSFTTACGAYAVPVLEPLTTFLPTCWQEADNGDLTAGPAIFLSGSWLVDGFANVGTTGAARVTLDAATDNDWVISPLFTIPAVGYELKFDAAATQTGVTSAPTTAWESDDFVEVLVSTGMNNWTVLYTYNDINVPSNVGASNIIDLDAYSGQDVRFAFRAVEGATNGSAAVDFFIDNFEIRLTPACSEPTAIVTGNITSSSVEMSWTPPAVVPAVGYEYFVSTVNTTPTVNGTSVATSFATPGGLLSNTTYYIFVRSDCGAGVYSAWTGPVSFTTACGAYAVPVLEPLTTFLPACWQEADNGDLTAGPAIFLSGSWLVDGFANVGTTGAARVTLDAATDNDWVISPLFTIPAVGYELKFDAAATQTGLTSAPTTAWESDDFVEVLVSTGMNNWTVLYTYNDINVPSNTGAVNIIDLDAYSGQDVRFAFRAVEGATNGTAAVDFFIDNFQIRLTPTCIEPLNLVYSSVTNTTANISWDPTTPIPTTGYEYFVSTSNTVPVTAGTSTTSTFAALSSLLPNTTYYVFVRSDCSAGDFSSWTGPTSFYTGYCLPSSSGTASYVNNFSTTGGSQNISNLASGFTAGGYLNASSQFVEGYETSSFNFNSDIVGGTVGFSIWIDWNNDLVFNNTTEKVFNTTAYSNGPFSGTINIPAGTSIGNYRMRITTDWNASNPSNPCAAATRAEFEDYTISVIAPPACVPPSASASGVTDVAANINWASVPSATLGYEYVLDNVATDPAGSGTATTAITYPASGLTQSTTYYFHIRSVCSVGTYSTWTTISFTTIATPPVNDDCGTAIAISSMPYSNTQDATAASQTAFVTACANTMNDGVWYTVVGNGYDIIVDINAVVGWDPQVDVYTGSCGTFTCVGSADVGVTSGSESFTISASVLGTTYYINIGYWSGSTNSSEGPFTINVSSPLNAASFDTANFVAYPNPVKDVLNLSYKTAISNVKVINLLGQEVLNSNANANDVQVNMSALTAGAYIVNITVEDTVHTIKVIKE